MAIACGATVRGSWNNNMYHILKKIGEGSFGTVFLVETKRGGKLALKLSQHVTSITNEYKILSSLSNNHKLQELQALPSLFDTDDCTVEDQLYRFIALEYLEGSSLGELLNKGSRLSVEELVQIGCSLGKIIQCFHHQQLTLGDIKPSNLICQWGKPLKVVDFGGVTKFGQPVEEYTQLLDRESWGMGSRIAEPSYDIFSCCLLLMLLATGNSYLSWTRGINGLQEEVDLLTHRELKEAIWQGIVGEYKNIEQLIEKLEYVKNFIPHSRKLSFH